MRVALGALGLVVLLAAPAAAADWGQIKPAVSTLADVRARYGAPTRETPQQIDGYDTLQWTYEGAQAPAGIAKMIVEFGLLTPSGYKKDVVRAFRLEPKPDIFNRKLVVDGWGPPSRIGKEGDLEFFLYEQGLLVYFSQDAKQVLVMIFTPPQKLPPAEPAAPRPPQR
ncbi:MAG: hypothetical protein DMD87_21290 [Candidatus Rokuibacteriota bacterium]|nr:MAG: hypothetical protein DMD87_21290 [Candidatus Rokubacteria bacterium]